MNELCFVWGAPLSGQLCWMARAAQDAEANIDCRLLPVENHSLEVGVDVLLEQVSKEMARHFAPGQEARHIYCELPWNALLDDLLIEEWITSQKVFKGREPEWNLSFVGLISEDAYRLPESSRRLMEEFARASHSTVILLRVEGDEGRPSWLGTDVLDFGRRLEVFEETLWPKAIVGPTAPLKNLKVFELDAVTLPVKGDAATLNDLFEDLEKGVYGEVWAAEAFWKNSESQFEAMTLTQGIRYSWVSDVPSLIDATVSNGALLNVAGGPLMKQNLFASLRSQIFC